MPTLNYNNASSGKLVFFQTKNSRTIAGPTHAFAVGMYNVNQLQIPQKLHVQIELAGSTHTVQPPVFGTNTGIVHTYAAPNISISFVIDNLCSRIDQNEGPEDFVVPILNTFNNPFDVVDQEEINNCDSNVFGYSAVGYNCGNVAYTSNCPVFTFGGAFAIGNPPYNCYSITEEGQAGYGGLPIPSGPTDYTCGVFTSQQMFGFGQNGNGNGTPIFPGSPGDNIGYAAFINQVVQAFSYNYSGGGLTLNNTNWMRAEGAPSPSGPGTILQLHYLSSLSPITFTIDKPEDPIPPVLNGSGYDDCGGVMQISGTPPGDYWYAGGSVTITPTCDPCTPSGPFNLNNFYCGISLGSCSDCLSTDTWLYDSGYHDNSDGPVFWNEAECLEIPTGSMNIAFGGMTTVQGILVLVPVGSVCTRTETGTPGGSSYAVTFNIPSGSVIVAPDTNNLGCNGGGSTFTINDAMGHSVTFTADGISTVYNSDILSGLIANGFNYVQCATSGGNPTATWPLTQFAAMISTDSGGARCMNANVYNDTEQSTIENILQAMLS